MADAKGKKLVGHLAVQRAGLLDLRLVQRMVDHSAEKLVAKKVEVMVEAMAQLMDS